MQEATSAIELAQGSREELRAIGERSRDVTTAAAELQTESNRQEAAVNEETNRTTAVLNKLAAAIDTADECQGRRQNIPVGCRRSAKMSAQVFSENVTRLCRDGIR